VKWGIRKLELPNFGSSRKNEVRFWLGSDLKIQRPKKNGGSLGFRVNPELTSCVRFLIFQETSM